MPRTTFAGQAAGSPPALQQASARTQDQATNAPSSEATSFVSDVFNNVRNALGFSVGSYSSYDSNVLIGTSSVSSASMTSVFPRVFINLGRRRSQFHLDYGTSFRVQDSRHNPQSQDHTGAMSYRLELSRRRTLNLAYRGTYNVYGINPVTGPAGISDSPVASVITEGIDQQRRRSHSGSASLTQQLNRDSSLGFNATYATYRFDGRENENASTILMSVEFSHRMGRSVTLVANGVGNKTILAQSTPGAMTTRISLGTRLELPNNFHLSATGGADHVEAQSASRTDISYQTELTHTHGTTSLSLAYSKGTTTALGVAAGGFSGSSAPGGLRSHNARGRIAFRVAERLNAYGTANYSRNANPAQAGILQLLGGGAGLEFRLPANMVASLDYEYRQQRTLHSLSQSGSPDRYIIRFGLQILVSSLQ
jgi:opacity protein-like surface antigen